jgi:hypothetical protein
MTPRLLCRYLALLCIGGYAVARFANAAYWDLLDDVDLAIHEAGHVLFQGFGDPAYTVGGSLFQVIVPLVFVGYFLRSRQRFAAAVVMAWAGVSLLNVARYIADSRVQALPLLGGENAVHDWWFLLTEWDLLPRDTAIARGVAMGAASAFVIALAGGFACAADPPPPGASAGD